MNNTLPRTVRNAALSWSRWLTGLILITITLLGSAGCGSSRTKQPNDFFTSGSREADQRAGQRMARDEQLSGTNEGAAEDAKKAEADKPSPNGQAEGGTNKAARVVGKLTLFDRLGGEAGIVAIVEDFTARALQDPRVNWRRTDVSSSGFFAFLHKSPRISPWTPTPENLRILKTHITQFIILATGGPPHYEGRDIKTSHSGMRISNHEFDATLGDLKASLDRLQIPNKEQKELLSVIESTRPQIVTER